MRGAGGLLLCAALVALLMELCCEALIAASNRSREYKKNRKEFFEWMESKNRETT